MIAVLRPRQPHIQGRATRLVLHGKVVCSLIPSGFENQDQNRKAASLEAWACGIATASSTSQLDEPRPPFPGVLGLTYFPADVLSCPVNGLAVVCPAEHRPWMLRQTRP